MAIHDHEARSCVWWRSAATDDMTVQGGNVSKFAWIKSPKFMHAMTAGFMIAFGVLYIGQVNAAATKGYAIRDLERKNEVIRQEQERLEVEIARLRSLDSVTTREAFLGLKKIDDVKYVSVGSHAVALGQ